MRKVAPPEVQFHAEMWSSDHELVLFFGADVTPERTRWSFCVKRSTLATLHPDLDPIAAFESSRKAIYRAAREQMLRGQPALRGQMISVHDIIRGM